jgi:hypothetical protein
MKTSLLSLQRAGGGGGRCVTEEERGVELQAWRSDVSGAALLGEMSIWVALDGGDVQTEGAQALGGGVMRQGGVAAGDRVSGTVAMATTEEKATTAHQQISVD